VTAPKPMGCWCTGACYHFDGRRLECPLGKDLTAEQYRETYGRDRSDYTHADLHQVLGGLQ